MTKVSKRQFSVKSNDGGVIKSLNDNNIDFVIIGGQAMSYYFETYSPDDIDIVVKTFTDEKFLEFLVQVFEKNGKSKTLDDLRNEITPTKSINLKEFCYTEILLPLPGMSSFDELLEASIEETYDTLDDILKVKVVSLPMLKKLKKLAAMYGDESQKKKHKEHLEKYFK